MKAFAATLRDPRLAATPRPWDQHRVLLLVVLAVLSMAPCAFAAPGDIAAGAVTPHEAQGNGNRELDEVIVDARKAKLSQLRLELEASEDAFYDAYNHANTVPEFQVRCDVEQASERRAREHVCTPQFVIAATTDEVKQVLGSFSPPPEGYPGRPASMVINGKLQAYREHLRDLAHKDPQLRKALLDYYALARRYEAVRKEKFKGKWVVWD